MGFLYTILLLPRKSFLFLTYVENKLKVTDAKIWVGLETDLVKKKKKLILTAEGLGLWVCFS